MRVKQFDFPTYHEWISMERKFKVKLGEYYCSCDIFSWSGDSTTFIFAVSPDEIPSNIYSQTIFKRVFEYNYKDPKSNLHKWYLDTIQEFQDFWVDYIMATYFE